MTILSAVSGCCLVAIMDADFSLFASSGIRGSHIAVSDGDIRIRCVRVSGERTANGLLK